MSGVSRGRRRNAEKRSASATVAAGEWTSDCSTYPATRLKATGSARHPLRRMAAGNSGELTDEAAHNDRKYLPGKEGRANLDSNLGVNSQLSFRNFFDTFI